jgi:hypothetical protein
MAQIQKGKPMVERQDILSHTRATIREFVQCLAKTRWISKNAGAFLEITERDEEKETDPIQPVKLIGLRKPIFCLGSKALEMYNAEFARHLPDVDGTILDRLPSTYAATVAVGEFAFREKLNNPARTRTPQELNEIQKLIGDVSIFREHFVEEFGSKPLGRVLSNFSD